MRALRFRWCEGPVLGNPACPRPVLPSMLAAWLSPTLTPTRSCRLSRGASHWRWVAPRDRDGPARPDYGVTPKAGDSAMTVAAPGSGS